VVADEADVTLPSGVPLCAATDGAPIAAAGFWPGASPFSDTGGTPMPRGTGVPPAVLPTTECADFHLIPVSALACSTGFVTGSGDPPAA
jgi:hypothetical protein